MRWDTKARRDQLRNRAKALKKVKVWQLAILLLISLLVAATMLRLNSLNMRDLRKDVITADEKGDAAEIEKAVNDLGKYVTTHMNTELGGGFYLASSYERAKQAVIKAAETSDNPQSALYQQASVQCQTERFRSGGYVQCVLNKVKELGGPDNIVSEIKLPRSETYKINFVSPLWSPDAAGISIAISVLIIVLIVIRLTGAVILRLLLKQRFKSIS